MLNTTNLNLRPIRKHPPADASPELLEHLGRWQNNSPEGLGFFDYCFDLFPDIVLPEYGLPDWAFPAFSQVLEWKPGYDKFNKQHLLCTPRDFAKTTYVKMLVSYCITVGQYGIYWNNTLLPEFDLIRFRGKNFEEAEKRTFDIRALINSPRVVKLFGALKPTYREVRVEEMKANVKLMMFKNGYVLVPLGLNQPSRGFNIKNKRPKLDIDDDVENKDNTKTQGSREYNQGEILGEQLGGLDQRGMTIYIYNMVHPQCAGKAFEDSGVWKTIPERYHKATYFDEKGVEHSSWEKRFPMSYWKRAENFYRKNNKYKIFRLEYYNETVGEGEYTAVFFAGEYERKEDMNWVKIRDAQGKETWHKAYIVVSGDPAISDDKDASIPAISVVAFCSDRKRRILDIRMNKYDIVDRYLPDKAPSNGVLALTSEDLSNVKKRGMVSEMARLIIRYNADMFVLERAGAQTAWYNDLIDLIDKLYRAGILRKKPSATTYHPNENKTIKLTENLMNHISAGSYEILESIPHKRLIEVAIESFPGGNKDILDSIHNAERMAFNKIPDLMIKTVYNTFKPNPEKQEFRHPYFKLFQDHPDLDLYDVMP